MIREISVDRVGTAEFQQSTTIGFDDRGSERSQTGTNRDRPDKMGRGEHRRGEEEKREEGRSQGVREAGNT